MHVRNMDQYDSTAADDAAASCSSANPTQSAQPESQQSMMTTASASSPSSSSSLAAAAVSATTTAATATDDTAMDTLQPSTSMMSISSSPSSYASLHDLIFKKYHFQDIEFEVPIRYEQLIAKGIGAQGTVW